VVSEIEQHVKKRCTLPVPVSTEIVQSLITFLKFKLELFQPIDSQFKCMLIDSIDQAFLIKSIDKLTTVL